MIWACCCLFVVLLSCGKDETPVVDPDTSQEEEPITEEPSGPEVLTGVFKDAEVEGLSFETATQSGITNTNGEFTYVSGEEITFKVGNIILGKAMGQALITPITLAQNVDANATIASRLAQNIAAFLQTLDADGDESNGIKITMDAVTNLGVTSIDFNAPIEAVLADIVLNVAQNSSLELQVVYPAQAANAMASSLGITYEAPENLVITHLLPALKTYFETWDANYTSSVAMYRTTFDGQGNLVALDIISRYSGKVFYTMDFSSFLANGLPETGQITEFASNSLVGATPRFAQFTNAIAFTYNQDDQLASLGFVDANGFAFNTNQFTAHDDENRPLEYFRDLAADNPDRDFTISWSFTYENGVIATARRVFFDLQTLDANNSFQFVSTRNFRYEYDASGKVSRIDYDRVFQDDIISGGVLETFVTESLVTDVFTYDGDQKLVGYSTNEEVNPSNGEPYTAARTRTYDGNELLVSVSYAATNGRESTQNYQEGIATTSEDFNNGLLSFSSEYFADGSFVNISYQYDANGILAYKETNEYGPSGIEFRTQEFYFDGVLDFYTEAEFDQNGFIATITYFDSQNVPFQINNYTYDSLGRTATVEVLFGDGSPWFNETWEYDSNGFLSRVVQVLVDGFTNIYYYENGQLVRGEFYDDNGVLYDTIDYTNSGKTPVGKALGRRIKMPTTHQAGKQGRTVLPTQTPLLHRTTKKGALQTAADLIPKAPLFLQ